MDRTVAVISGPATPLVAVRQFSATAAGFAAPRPAREGGSRGRRYEPHQPLYSYVGAESKAGVPLPAPSKACGRTFIFGQLKDHIE